MRKVFAYLLLVVGALLISHDAFAQSGLPANSSSFALGTLRIVSTPEFPEPGQTVSLQLDSGSVPVDTAAITWSVNGKVVATGVGMKDYSTVAGGAGSQTTVSATLKAPGGQALTTSIQIMPIAIDLIWQANSITPPFYEGKAMYGPMSDLKFIAIPHFSESGGEIAPGNLVYEWRLNGLAYADRSGYGRNSISAGENFLGRPVVAEVTVRDVNGKRKARKEITISWFDPKLLIYENSPLYGVIGEKAIIGETELKGKEMSFWAYPYFFSPGSFGTDVKFSWSMNSAAVADSNKNSMIFRNEDDRKGSSLISVTAQYPAKLFQQAAAKFNLRLSGSENRATF